MPVLSKADLRIDYADEGAGPPVVLIHSSVSGNRQWRALTEALRDRYRVLALNLYGYGETTPWPGTEQQSLADQAELVLAVCDEAGDPSGSSVTPSAARSRSPPRCCWASALPTWCCSSPIRSACFSPGIAPRGSEIHGLREAVTGRIAAGDWPGASQLFADYWLGGGTWDAMPDGRRTAFAEALAQNPYEWQAVMDEETRVEEYSAIAARTLVVSDPETRRPIREIVEIFAAGLSRLVVPLAARGRPHGAADAARAGQPDRAGVPRLRSLSAAGRRRSAPAGGSGRPARRPCRPPRASGS